MRAIAPGSSGSITSASIPISSACAFHSAEKEYGSAFRGRFRSWPMAILISAPSNIGEGVTEGQIRQPKQLDLTHAGSRIPSRTSRFVTVEEPFRWTSRSAAKPDPLAQESARAFSTRLRRVIISSVSASDRRGRLRLLRRWLRRTRTT